ncbi:MAG: lytic transglycosylase domain-containing protein [Nocardioides sp.]
MSKHTSYAPKHRGGHAQASARRAPKRLVKTVAALSIVAAGATGAAVSGGVFAAETRGGAGELAAFGRAPTTTDSTAGDSTAGDSGAGEAADNSADSSATGLTREPVVSRSDSRGTTDQAKAAALTQSAGRGVSRTEDMAGEDPRTIAKALLTEFGFGQDQFGCLDALYTAESGWRVNADNPRSSAYGIPQALPGSKMASAGPDWATNPVTQIRWGLGYIQDRYGSPCGAWGFKRGHGWY